MLIAEKLFWAAVGFALLLYAAAFIRALSRNGKI